MMKENSNTSSILKGHTTMKKYIFVSALAALLVFAFAAVAGAKYAGYALDGSKASPTAAASTTPGYLSWGGATQMMAANGLAAINPLAQTAHGGYITTTTKCAVCHSVHRATGQGTTVGVAKNLFLTNSGDSCVQCHTAWGSTQAALLVEWGNPADNAGTTGGPHGSSQCATCHQGGIHGSSTSQYWGMNAYMLGGVNDGMIATELPYQDRTLNGGNALVTSLTSTYTDGTGTNTDWFVNGSTVNTAIGGIPSGILDSAGKPASNIYAAARSLLTGFTCSRAGCHVNSVFGNITWGQTYARRQGATSGSDTTSPMMLTTGHSTAPGAGSNHDSLGGTDHSGCAPCHPGNPSGGYRLATLATVDPINGLSIKNSFAYGCDQCHDAVGVATNSTAFPHGNRGIQIYQWTNGTSGASAYADPTPTLAAAGNIWMYQSNMASVAGSTATLVDPSVTLTQGATQGKNATLGPANAGMIVDGACLKCHVPADSQSAAAYGLSTPLAIGAGHHGPAATYPPPATGGWAVGLDINDLNPYSGASISGATLPSTGGDGSRLSNHWLYLWK